VARVFYLVKTGKCGDGTYPIFDKPDLSEKTSERPVYPQVLPPRFFHNYEGGEVTVLLNRCAK
jgi:hypothetical protein